MQIFCNEVQSATAQFAATVICKFGNFTINTVTGHKQVYTAIFKSFCN